jgi:D-glycero-alpha-D-manno-heptose-7-phosphate kinase
VIVNPLRVRPTYLYEFEASLVVCFTGQSRASAIIQERMKPVTKSDEDALQAMHQLRADAVDMR